MFQNPTTILDLTGKTCPAPLLGAKKMLEKLDADQTLTLISDCAGTHDDLLAWCQLTGNTLISATQRDQGGTAYLLQNSRGADVLTHPHATLDMRGVACPGPIIASKKVLNGMASGEVLQLISDCSAASDDIRLWSQETSIELLLIQQAAKGASTFYLKKH